MDTQTTEVQIGKPVGALARVHRRVRKAVIDFRSFIVLFVFAALDVGS